MREMAHGLSNPPSDPIFALLPLAEHAKLLFYTFTDAGVKMELLAGFIAILAGLYVLGSGIYLHSWVAVAPIRAVLVTGILLTLIWPIALALKVYPRSRHSSHAGGPPL